jgi:hypothetical protein
MAARGANVCRVHGGSAPQVKAAAQRRIQQALDAAAKRLTGFAFDEGVSESIALAAVNGILDRGGLGAKQALEVSAKPPEPWMELLGDVAHLTKSQHDAIYHPERAAQAPALAAPVPADDIVDAEVVPDDPVPHPEHNEDRAEASRVPDWAEPPPSKPPSRELATLEDAAAEVAQANRAARVTRARQRR